jgi:HK97 gp10 family phage protein
MQVKIKITGLKEIQSGLQNLQEGLQRTSDLLMDAGYLVEAQAKMNASGRPGPNVQSGNLRSSIVTSLASPVSVIVGTNTNYAPYVEFGHAQQIGRFVYQIGKRLVNPRAPAYPFLIPALSQSVDKIRTLVINYINKVWGKT